MKAVFPKTFQPLLAFGLTGAVAILDLFFAIHRGFSPTFRFLKELLLLLAVISFIPVLQRSKFIQNKDVLTKLKALYLGVAGLYLIYLGFELIFEPLLRNLIFSTPRGSFLPAFFNAILGLGMSILTAIILVGVLIILKDLIYYKRKRSSARNFFIFIFLLGLRTIVVSVEDNYAFIQGSWFNQSDVLLFLLIVLMVINSFRNSWVNYLNKKQKIRGLWLGIPLVSAAIVFAVLISGRTMIGVYSASLSTFIESTALFLSVYLGMGFFSLVLHLPTAGMFDRKLKEIESLQDLSHAASSVLDPEAIVNKIASKSASLLKSDALWLQIKDWESGDLKIVASKNFDEKELKDLDSPTSDGIIAWIIQNKQSVLINEISKDERCRFFRKFDSKFGSLLGVPLVAKDDVFGILFSARRDVFAYDEDDRKLLQAFANQASIALENSRLINELLSKERFEQELIVAREAQRKLLPKKMPQIKGLELDAVSIAATEVGGDYYDFFEIDNMLAIAVGDVSGKGAQAAFYMAELKGVIESASHLFASPKELMVHINKILFGNLERKTFISLIYSLIDMKKKEMVFSRAGHCPLLFCSNSSSVSEFMEPPGIGLGLEEGKKFEKVLSEQRIKLKLGDILVFYTDGVTEARNASSFEFDEERLKSVVTKNTNLNATQLKELLVKEIQNFVGESKTHDDLTFIVAKVT